MSAGKSAVWFVAPSVRTTYSEDGAALLDITKGTIYGLNAVAARVWVTIESSDGGITLDGIVTALESHFEIPREQLQADTAQCLENLQRKGLVHCNGHGSLSQGA